MCKKNKLVSLLLMLTIIITMTLGSATVSFGATSSEATKYWVKVNAQANVVTVYKKVDKKWKPYRAMLCSTGTGKGKSSEATPVGNFRVSNRWDWGAMVGGVYARYVVQFYGDFLFHSVPYEEYKNPKSMPAKEYNKLGKDASHGCVRLSLMDAKWVYDNIPRGTKVTIYNSKSPGPLGKPSGIKLPKSPKLTWDPTDTNKKNTKYQLPKPVIKIDAAKKTVVKPGASYKLKAGVTAVDPNTFQNLTNLITVSKVLWYDEAKGKYVEKKFSSTRRGLYKVTYKVKYKYGGTTYKTLKIQVADTLAAPVVSASSDAASGTIQLSWQPVKDAAKYQVYRAPTTDGKYVLMCTTRDTMYVNNYDVVYGTTYYYKVKAITGTKKHINSNYSKIVSCLVQTTSLPAETPIE